MPPNTTARTVRNDRHLNAPCTPPAPRLEWRLERVWALDEESSDEDVQAYEKASKAVAGRLIHPRCLDDYVYAAWHFAEIVDIDSENNPDEDSPASRDVVSSPEFIQALEWAQAGVVVLQQSLPWPFTGGSAVLR